MMKTIGVVLALLAIGQAQIMGPGVCPEGVQVIDNFDVQKFLGTWHEYARYPLIFEANGKCTSAAYTLKENGDVCVLNTQINEKTGEVETIEGTATPVSNGKLLVSFQISPDFKTEGNYWVLDTDYTNYAVVYSCQTISQYMHATNAWILTRARVPAVTYIDVAKEVLAKNKVALKGFQITDQTSCN